MEIADGSMKKAGSFTKSAAELAAKIMLAMAEYLEKESELAPQKALAAWIRKNGQIFAYNVQGDCKKELIYEMDKNGVPYVDTGKELLIRQPDIPQVKGLNREILIAKGRYFQEVDGREMENAIAIFEKMPNKEIFTLHGLNMYQAEVLKNKCNNITAGFMVGITKTDDDKYDLSVSTSHIYNKDLKRKDFCDAYLQMSLSLWGPNNYIKMSQIDADIETEKKIAELKGDPNVHYIIGVDDPTKFVEINSQGFEYYETQINEETGIRQDKLIKKCELDDPNYDSELQIYTDRIFNKAIVNDTNEFNKHMSTKDRIINSNRPRKNQQQYQNSIATDQIGEKINEMVKAKINNNFISFSNISELFTYYQSEAANILSATIDGQIIAGYAPKDFLEISKILDNNNVKANVYSNSVHQLKDFKSESHTARKMVKEVEKEVNKTYGFTNR